MNRDPSAFDNLTDAALVAASLAGDKGAFGRIVTRHWPRVHRVAARCLADAFEVDDIAQEAFLQAYLSLTMLRDSQHVGAWVCGIAANLARMRLRSQRDTSTLEGWEIADGVTPEAITIQNERLSHLYDTIDTLPPAERAAIWHVYRDGMSLRETAAKLAISLSATKVRIHRGRQRLRHQLTEQLPMIPVDIHDKLFWVNHVGPRTPSAENRHLRTLTFDEAALLLEEARKPFQEHIQNRPYPLGEGRRSVCLLLKEHKGDRAVPIWIDPVEADTIVLERSQPTWSTRPQTYDLMLRILETGGITIKQLVISSLENSIFIGTLTLNCKGEMIELDCRPSDGMALATKLGFPMFMAPEIMNRSSTTPNEQGEYVLKPAS